MMVRDRLMLGCDIGAVVVQKCALPRQKVVIVMVDLGLRGVHGLTVARKLLLKRMHLLTRAHLLALVSHIILVDWLVYDVVLSYRDHALEIVNDLLGGQLECPR